MAAFVYSNRVCSDKISQLKTKLTLLISLLLFAANSLALEVGELTLLSKLGEPLSAQVNFSHQPRLSAEEFIVEQAPVAIYQKMGVDTDALYIDLNFKVDPGGFISIRTQDPVKEPFLSFVVKFQWPNGELYREYNLLIDP